MHNTMKTITPNKLRVLISLTIDEGLLILHKFREENNEDPRSLRELIYKAILNGYGVEDESVLSSLEKRELLRESAFARHMVQKAITPKQTKSAQPDTNQTYKE